MKEIKNVGSPNNVIELTVTHISDTSITARCNQETFFSSLYNHWQWIQHKCGFRIGKIYSLISTKEVIVFLIKNQAT
jgi:hypothetical protein